MSVGFGICGHKSTYCTKVLNGNWVEDTVGAELALRASSKPMKTLSENADNFKRPVVSMEERSRNLVNVAADSVKMQGLPAHTLFAHGQGAPQALSSAADSDRFVTSNQLVNSTVVDALSGADAKARFQSTQSNNFATRARESRIRKDSSLSMYATESTDMGIQREEATIVEATAHGRAGGFTKSFPNKAFLRSI